MVPSEAFNSLICNIFTLSDATGARCTEGRALMP
jgi:hypothetical protein